MPPFTLSGPVLQTSAPPIPKAQAWSSSYTPTPDLPLLNLSQGVPGEAPEPVLVDSLKDWAGKRDSANYGNILGEEGLRRAVGVEMRDMYRWGEEAGVESVPIKGIVNGEASAPVAEEGGRSEQASPGSSGDGRGVSVDNIAITSGCNQAFFIAMSAICQDGDEIILPCPWYFNMLMTCQLLRISPIPLPLSPSTSFLPDPTLIPSLLTPKTKAIVLVSPNNPTGTTYPPSLIKEFYDLAKKHGIALVVDETYRDFVLPQADSSGIVHHQRGQPHRLFEEEDWGETLVSLFSFSKSYKIPGYRLGGIVGGSGFLKRCEVLMDCIQICAPKLPQLALAPILPTLRPSLLQTSQSLSTRQSLFTHLISSLPGWTVSSQGSYFAYVKHPFPGITSEAVAERLGKEVGLLVLPGGWFMPERGGGEWGRLVRMGAEITEDRWLRFSIANVSDEVIRKVPERLERLNEMLKEEFRVD